MLDERNFASLEIECEDAVAEEIETKNAVDGGGQGKRVRDDGEVQAFPTQSFHSLHTHERRRLNPSPDHEIHCFQQGVRDVSYQLEYLFTDNSCYASRVESLRNLINSLVSACSIQTLRACTRISECFRRSKNPFTCKSVSPYFGVYSMLIVSECCLCRRSARKTEDGRFLFRRSHRGEDFKEME